MAFQKKTCTIDNKEKSGKGGTDEKMNTLIIDIGTSSMRGILFDRAGEKLAVHQVKYQPDKLPDGRIEQSPEDWTGSLTAIASKIA